MRRLRWLLILPVITIIGGHSSSEPGGVGAFRQLLLTPEVADNLALLFRKFDTEFVVCLEGEHRGPDLYVTDFRFPHILLSETGRVQASACPRGPRAIGTWHNHPAPRLRLARGDSEALARNCYLSRTDISDFQRRDQAAVTVVSCAPYTFAYWTRTDVGAVDEEITVLPPPEGRLVRGEAADESPVSDLTQARRQ